MSYEDPPCVSACSVFKQRGRWYVALTCPGCCRPLRVRLSLGPMVARCESCSRDVEADVGPLITAGRA